MADGVTMTAPDTVHLAWDTQIARRRGDRALCGVRARASTIEAGAVIRAFSHLEGARRCAPGAIIGPYARLRPGADIGAGRPHRQLRRGQEGQGRRGRQGQPPVLSGRRHGRRGGQHRRRARSSATTTASTSSRPMSARTPSSAPTPPWSRRSPSARRLHRLRLGDHPDVSPDALALERGRQVEKPGWAAAFRERKRRAKGLVSRMTARRTEARGRRGRRGRPDRGRHDRGPGHRLDGRLVRAGPGGARPGDPRGGDLRGHGRRWPRRWASSSSTWSRPGRSTYRRRRRRDRPGPGPDQGRRRGPAAREAGLGGLERAAW